MLRECFRMIPAKTQLNRRLGLLLSLALFAFSLVSCSTGKQTNRAVAVATHAGSQMIPCVVIDAGHGGFDRGANTRIVEEKEINLRCALLLQKQLQRLGYRVIMTRSIDEYIPLKKRAEIANQSRSQVLVSIHFNAAINASAHGVEVYYCSKTEPWRMARSKSLAQSVLNKILSHTEAYSRGVKEGNFCVIRETKMPSILVEGGFITNSNEQRKLIDNRYLNKLALAIAEGLDRYFKQ